MSATSPSASPTGFEPPPVHPVLAVATRSGRSESFHRGAVAVWHGGAQALAVGDVHRLVHARSAVKPLQALPFLERGLHVQLGLPAEEIAVMCASHDGAPVHTAAVRSLLARGGLREEHLGCGPHAPFDAATRQELQRSGVRPGKLHNNCSGKHSGFLHLARACGDDLARYLEPDSAAQREVAAAVAAMAGVPEPVPIGLDGCGAPTFLLPLAALARAFARLVAPAGAAPGAAADELPPARAAACRTIVAAAGAAPALLAGERRFCTALLRQWPGRVFAKNGAEGVYALGLAPDAARPRWPGALGIAIKIDDGDERGYQPVLVDLLRHLGALPAGPSGTLSPALAAFAPIVLENTQQKRVGDVRCVHAWGAP